MTGRLTVIRHHCKTHKYSEEYQRYWLDNAHCQVDGCRDYSVAPHHIRTRGAGGDDAEDNLLALCARHHAEVHQMGTQTFGRLHPELVGKITLARARAR